MDKAILSAVLHRMQQRRAEQEALAEQRRWEVSSRIPRIGQIDRELKGTAIRAIRTAFAAGEDSAASIEALSIQNLALQQEKRELLAKHGYPANYLSPMVFCEICKDTGYVDAKLCDCVRRQCAEEQTRQLSTILPIDRENFSTFSLDYYSSTIDRRLGASPRYTMENNLSECRAFAEEFGNHSRNLLLYGSTGLGKTFLSSCIARAVSEKGFSVAYDTAISIFDHYNTVKFGGNTWERSSAVLEKYHHADLLIVDDLGTEMTTAFTISCLYDLLNRRLMEHRPMIINTNLQPPALEKQYSPAIASRILGQFLQLRFLGTDIRKQKNAEIL